MQTEAFVSSKFGIVPKSSSFYSVIIFIAESSIWQYFQRSSQGVAKCNICTTMLKCKGSTTTLLWNHMRTKHNDVLTAENHKQTSNERTSTKPSSQSTLCDCVNRESLEEIISKLCARDNFLFHSIINLHALNDYIRMKGFQIPKSINTITAMMEAFYLTEKMNFLVIWENSYPKESALEI